MRPVACESTSRSSGIFWLTDPPCSSRGRTACQRICCNAPSRSLFENFLLQRVHLYCRLPREYPFLFTRVFSPHRGQILPFFCSSWSLLFKLVDSYQLL